LAKEFPALTEHHRKFIERQRLFFCATAAPGARVNISPRSTDWLRLISDSSVAWLDRTGSGNESAAHQRAGGGMTMMFCAFEGPPLILRLYGRGTVVARGSEEYRQTLAGLFGGTEPKGARQIMRLDVELVKTSCGYGVPFFDYVGERDQIDRWCDAKGEAGLVAYRQEKNLVSMDGLPTGFIEDAGVVAAE
jgi:hypothetical protein